MRDRLSTPEVARLVRYGLVSVVSTVMSLGLLYLFFRVVKVGSAVDANIIATTIATVPSYYLNRTWAWGRTGRSHLMREVVPFWTIAAISLLLSTIAVGLADNEAHRLTHSHFVETVFVLGANFATYGVIWVGKFLLFNRVLFVDRSAGVEGPQAEPVYASSSSEGS